MIWISAEFFLKAVEVSIFSIYTRLHSVYRPFLMTKIFVLFIDPIQCVTAVIITGHTIELIVEKKEDIIISL